MSNVTDMDKARQVSEIARELGRVSRSLTGACLTVELALDRRDWSAVHDAAEMVISASARFRRLRRSLLVLRARHASDFQDVPDELVLAPEPALWGAALAPQVPVRQSREADG